MNELRVQNFDNFVGQENVVKRLRISIEAAKKRNDVLSHVLFDGNAGCGKTTLAQIISKELDVSVHLNNGGNLRSIKKLLPCVMKLSNKSILFIDEIHRLSPAVMDLMLNVMEDFQLHLTNDEETTTLDLKPFTLIGATTQSGKLIKPFYDRFPIKCHLETYKVEELVKLIQSTQQKLSVSLNEKAQTKLAERSRGIPRIVNNFLLWLRDYISHKNISTVNEDVLDEAFSIIDIDQLGLDIQDRKYINTLKVLKGGPTGLSTIAASSGLDRDTIINKIEPYLLKLNLIGKCPKGRFLI